ncbi:MAG TPA: hypothetical protein VGQ91_12730 [Ideonella sp.]|nr:hypothetical protein [Ideonella sp.]
MLALLAGGLAALLAVGIGVAVMRPAEPPALAAAAPQPMAPAAAKEPVLDAAQWNQLQAALADHPQRDAETARVVELLAYQRSVRSLRAQRQSGTAAPALIELARRLDAELPLHLARGEMTGPEAMRLKATLLESLEPDPARRAEALAAWRDAQLQAHPRATDPRDAAFLQAQQALVAQWRATAPPGTPPDGLIAELEALRQRSYAPPPSNPKGDMP